MDNSYNLSAVLRYVSTKMEAAGNYVNDYLTELNGTETAAIILLLTAVVMTLALAVIWYIKSIVASIQHEKEKEREFVNRFDNRLDRHILDEDNNNDNEYSDDDEYSIKDAVNKKLKENKNRANITVQPADLDWERGALKKENNKIKFVSPDILTYQFKPHKLSDLLGLIIDLLERGVDEPKIAQSIMYKNQHLNSEDEIVQTIMAVKFFIHLCVNGRFQDIDKKNTLPQEDAALFHLANADGSLAVALLENLIDINLKKIKTAYNAKERNKIFNETSNLATILGSIAAFGSTGLAAKAFELAIEANPRNITAWGRLGDMFNILEDTEKAVWAYRNVLSLSDNGSYAQQTANANKMLSVYYYENGNRQQAKIMADKSTEYYTSIGINRTLTDKEIAALDIIETNSNSNMESIIEKLFSSKNFKPAVYF